jgi:hypothetical protein
VSTTVNAIISKEWKQRMLIICAAMAGMGGWFLFDGSVAYPRNNVKATAYFELQDKYGKETPELKAAWEELRKEKTWNEKIPKKIYTEGDIRTQWILGGLTVLGAVGVFVYFLKCLPTTTRLENGVITLPNGTQIPIDQVSAVSRKRWENKGIADLVWEPEPGKYIRFVLDDYKYIGAATILEEVEKLLPAAEPPPEDQADSTV